MNASRAFAFFELFLLALAPTIMRSDGWLSIGCGHPIQWIGADPIRLLAIDVLQSLLKSPLGECMSIYVLVLAILDRYPSLLLS